MHRSRPVPGNDFARGFYLPQTCQMKWTVVVTGMFQDMDWTLVPTYLGRYLIDSRVILRALLSTIEQSTYMDKLF